MKFPNNHMSKQSQQSILGTCVINYNVEKEVIIILKLIETLS